MSEAVLNQILPSNHDQLRASPKSDGIALIIDPLPASASITASALQAWGYSVDIVHSFSIALELLKLGETIPDLILVDILNPLHLKQAIKFPSDLKRETIWGNIPIIARSAMRETTTISRVLRAGYCDFIVAPVDREILKDRIDKVFHRTTSINPKTFPKPISSAGSLVADIQLASINEFGLEGYSNTAFAPHTVFTLQSDFLENLRLDQVMVKVVGCDPIKEGNWRFKLVLSFVGLTPLIQSRIRQFAIGSRPLK